VVGFVVCRTEVPERRVAALPVVEDLDVLEMALLAAARVGQLWRYRRSSLRVEKKLSATALSQQLAGRLRLDRIPWLVRTLV
jgi:hypothetical protein